MSIECAFLLVELIVLVVMFSHDLFGCEGRKGKKKGKEKKTVVVPSGGSVDRRW